jgi:hypothetical protein
MPKSVQSLLSYAVPPDDSVDIVMGKLPPGIDLITVVDIGSAMNISSGVVHSWIEDGRLPSLPCGAGEEREHRKISRNTFRRFLELRQQGLN